MTNDPAMTAIAKFLVKLVRYTSYYGDAHVYNSPTTWTDGVQINARPDVGTTRDVLKIDIYSGQINIAAWPDNDPTSMWMYHAYDGSERTES